MIVYNHKTRYRFGGKPPQGRRALEAMVLLHVRDSIRGLAGRPWTPEIAGEITRRISERLGTLFPLAPSEDQEIRRIIATVVHSAVRELRSKGEPPR